jgi:exonuclease III
VAYRNSHQQREKEEGIEDKESKAEEISLLLWNVEGLNSACNIMPENIFKKDYDVVILTETFLTEPRNIAGFYDFHCLAAQHQKGRPYGGISCFLKS